MMASGVWRSQRLDGHGAPPGQRQAQRAGDLEHVGVPPGVVEHEDLLDVVGALDDGEQVVLALGQQRGRHADVVHRVVDLVEADADPGADERDERQQRRRRPRSARGAAAAAPACASRRRRRPGTFGVGRRSRAQKPCRDRDRQCPSVERPGHRPGAPCPASETYGVAIALPLPDGFEVVAVGGGGSAGKQTSPIPARGGSWRGTRSAGPKRDSWWRSGRSARRGPAGPCGPRGRWRARARPGATPGMVTVIASAGTASRPGKVPLVDLLGPAGCVELHHLHVRAGRRSPPRAGR